MLDAFKSNILTEFTNYRRAQRRSTWLETFKGRDPKLSSIAAMGEAALSMDIFCLVYIVHTLGP